MSSVSTTKIRDCLLDHFSSLEAMENKLAEDARRTHFHEYVRGHLAYALSLRRVREHIASLSRDDPNLTALAEKAALNKEDSGVRILLGPDSEASLADLAVIHPDSIDEAIRVEQVRTWFTDWTWNVLQEAPTLRTLDQIEKLNQDITDSLEEP